MTPSPRWQVDLALARGGNREALGRILDAVRDYLRQIAKRELPENLRAKEDASDLVQQTFAEASQSFGLFRGASPEEWEAWLRRILLDNLYNFRREFHTHKRQVGRERPLTRTDAEHPEADWLPAPGPDPAELAAALEREAVLARAIEQLPLRYREVVRLRNQERLSFDAVGARLGLSADGAQKLWTRAVARLGQSLGGSV
jgi:RNA polymerase sigma-70 factor (ECF subfamily)